MSGVSGVSGVSYRCAAVAFMTAPGMPCHWSVASSAMAARGQRKQGAFVSKHHGRLELGCWGGRARVLRGLRGCSTGAASHEAGHALRPARAAGTWRTPWTAWSPRSTLSVEAGRSSRQKRGRNGGSNPRPDNALVQPSHSRREGVRRWRAGGDDGDLGAATPGYARHPARPRSVACGGFSDGRGVSRALRSLRPPVRPG